MEVGTETKGVEVPNNEMTQNVVQEKSPTPQPQDTTQVPKKSKNDKSKRDDRNVDQFMKSLNSVSSVDEKLSLACKKYVQATDDNKKLQFYIKQSDKRYALLLKEKEQLQHEYNKTVLVKSKLENLCRELQKQNKSIKDDSLTKIREEEERRKETQAKFQNTLSEITTLLQQNNEKNAKLRDDNIVITEKFKSVVQQYQLREQQVDKMTKQMNLESQLSDAKLQKAALEHQAEKERLMSEIEQLKVLLAQHRDKVMELQCVETVLKGQLSVYTSKYDEFQNALVKTNQVFGRSKEQIDKMSKKILQLEKESLTWRKRWESSQAALLDMCGERQTAGRRMLSLQGLCRTLQAERTTLLNTLKEHNIERPPLPPPSPPQANPADEKVDAMAANCATLKQSIAHLQNQINVFTTKKEEEPKQNKTKKSKSKKNKSEKAQKEKSEEPAPEVSVQEESAPEESAPEESAAEEIAPEACEIEPTIEEDKVENLEEIIDSGTMESLIQAISMANMGLDGLELEIGGEEKDQPNGVINEIEIANDSQEVISAKEVKGTTETTDCSIIVEPKETTELTDCSVIVEPKEIVEVKTSTNEASVDDKIKNEES